MRTFFDVHTEEQLRAGSVDYDSYVPMPESFWLQKNTLDDCLTKIEEDVLSGSKSMTENIFTVVQKYVMLDDMGSLLDIIHQNLGDILK